MDAKPRPELTLPPCQALVAGLDADLARQAFAKTWVDLVSFADGCDSCARTAFGFLGKVKAFENRRGCRTVERSRITYDTGLGFLKRLCGDFGKLQASERDENAKRRLSDCVEVLELACKVWDLCSRKRFATVVRPWRPHPAKQVRRGQPTRDDIKDLIDILTQVAMRHRPDEPKETRRRRIADVLKGAHVERSQRKQVGETSLRPCCNWTWENVRKHEKRACGRPGAGK